MGRNKKNILFKCYLWFCDLNKLSNVFVIFICICPLSGCGQVLNSLCSIHFQKNNKKTSHENSRWAVSNLAGNFLHKTSKQEIFMLNWKYADERTRENVDLLSFIRRMYCILNYCHFLVCLIRFGSNVE